MKRIVALLTSLVCAMLFSAAMAEDTPSPSPLLQLYQAEEALLFATDNVTMTGHAVFSINGQTFKTAELKHMQSGIASMRDWRLLTPSPLTGEDRETGYTVVTQGGNIFAYESHQHRHLWYIIDESLQRTSILGHNIASDNLTELAGLLLAQCGSIGDCSAVIGESGDTVITIHIGEDDLPPVLNTLLNSVLQYGISRYTGFDFASAKMAGDSTYAWYNTIPQGLVFCMKSVRLSDLSIQAALDAEGRLQTVSCTAVLAYEEVIGGPAHELRVVFEQNAYDYGTSQVNDDPLTYDHWMGDVPPDAESGAVSSYAHAAENTAAKQLFYGLYWDPLGSNRLHADRNCPSVDSRYLPLREPSLTPALLLDYSLCEACVDASPFLNELGEPSLDTAAGDLMAELVYAPQYGLNELFWDLDEQLGFFRSWSHAQKYRFTKMLPTLALREEERMAAYHPDFAADVKLRDMLGVWSYGLPAEGADDAAKDVAAACVLAKGLLTQEQLDTLQVTVHYYTGSKYTFPFAEPWWSIRYSDHTLPVCEVWVNSSLNSIHAADLQRMTDIAHTALMAQEPKLGDQQVTLEDILFFDHFVIYQPDESQWCCIVDPGTDSYWSISLADDDDLTLVKTEGGNG